MKKIILSLGGSIITPDKPDYFFLREFKNFIVHNLKSFSFLIVCGGGKLNSYYNEAALRISKISKTDLDWIGIMSTRLNAELVRSIFGKLAYPKVIYNPNSRFSSAKIVVAAGWKPGCSTDYDAVLLAKQFKSQEIINLTNVSHIYDKDPKYPDAKKLYKISWSEYLKIIGDKWTPRLSSPFDPIASKAAKKLNLRVVVMGGSKLSNVQAYLDGKNFEGTVIL